MFTGIVSDLGRVAAVRDGDGRELDVEAPFEAGSLEIGASVAHSGICLTITSFMPGGYRVFASAETLNRTTIGDWRTGDRVNLERSLKLGDELGGHLVFGHVDGVGTVRCIEPDGAGFNLRFAMPSGFASLVAVKGSIAVDGISLTVTDVDDQSFAVAVIPHTWEVTTLRDRKVGDTVNLEMDMLARYVARQLGFAAETAT